MAANDLTDLATLKLAADIVGPDADDQLSRLITAASSFIQRYTNRDVVQQAYTETRSGTGGRSMMLRQYPVTAVASLTVDGTSILQQAASGQSGFVLEPPRLLWLVGYTFTRNPANVVVAYTAGYAAGQIPADIEQACIELATLMFRQSGRIGDQSKTISAGGGHETTAFLMKSMTPACRDILDQFKNVVPV